VAASESRHSGQIRICVEAGLPLQLFVATLCVGGAPLRQVIRQRAVTMFGKLRVWDTERNNGVLVYLLLADHAIELVADRGLNAFVKSGGLAGDGAAHGAGVCVSTASKMG
jgi:uncharacterized membrane protein